MNKKTINQIKQAAKKDAQKRKDLRYLQTMTLLTRKGLLKANQKFKLYRPRININDAVWAGLNVEPRIIEVLPAAILHFPKAFTGIKTLPKDLTRILNLIRENAEEGPAFYGTDFKKMKFWANTPLRDKRTKPTREKRQTKTFRLKPFVIEKMNKLVSSGKYKSQSQVLEAALEKL